jgi:hypothetical protein
MREFCMHVCSRVDYLAAQYSDSSLNVQPLNTQHSSTIPALLLCRRKNLFVNWLAIHLGRKGNTSSTSSGWNHRLRSTSEIKIWRDIWHWNMKFRLGICGRHPSNEIAVPAKQGTSHNWQFSKVHSGSRFAHGFRNSIRIWLHNKITQATSRSHTKSW